jgi:hydroxymethylglutaryl-CoA reductase
MTKKFYEWSIAERQAWLLDNTHLTDAQLDALQTLPTANQQLIENVVGDFSLPVGVVQRLVVNHQAYTVPLVTEEASVVAAANYGAKMLASGAGIVAQAQQHQLRGQLLFSDVNPQALSDFVDRERANIFAVAQQAHPSMVARGGGLKEIIVRTTAAQQVSVDLLIDPQAAMGANVVNTIAEAVSALFTPFTEQFVGAILSNYTTESLVTVTGTVPFTALSHDVETGKRIAQKIARLSAFSQTDVYRATTENKGIFNGISAVVLATGNDWRATEAAGHAFATRDGRYRGLSTWTYTAEGLIGEMTVPLAIGRVGGSISALPQAQANLAIIGTDDVVVLRQIMASVGLAQNLAALKAIANGGIQRGHMRMQYRALALQVGAQNDEVAEVVAQLQRLTQVNEAVARDILQTIRRNHET